MTSIIDFHTHPFRRPENCLNFYPEMPALDAFGMRAQVEAAGISRVCGSVLRQDFHLDGFQSLRALNREALALRQELGEFYTPGYHVHPAFVRESCEEIEFMAAQGVRLMGELVPYMHEWGDFDGRAFDEILSAAPAGTVCCYHTPFDFDMNGLIDAHRDITFVAAHPGDRSRVPEQIELMRRHDNVCLDLSGTGLFRFGVLKHLVGQVGAERLLFGTDYPICNPRMYVQAVLGEDISDDDRQKIFHDNAVRLLPPTKRVVAAILCDDLNRPTRVFAAARGYGAQKGGWEFPGGKIEPGETPEAALRREIREELSAEIEIGRKLVTVEHDYPTFHLSMDCFLAAAKGSVTLNEAQEARWLTKETLHSVPWLPADLKILPPLEEVFQ